MKLKFTLLLLAMTLSAAVASAENYFTPGTTWTYFYDPDWLPIIDTIQLVEAVNQDGEECYQEAIHTVAQEYAGYEGEVVTNVRDRIGNFIKVDREKVYACSPKTGRAEWRLVYDFSLAPGEGCLIPAEIHKIVVEGDDYHHEDYDCDCFFKYEGDTYLDEFGREFMKINVYESEAESTDESNAIDTEYWLKGAGGVYHFTNSRVFCVPKDAWTGGSSYKLKCVTDAAGEIIVKDSKWAAIESVAADAQAEPVGYYDLQGRRLSEPAEGAVTIVRLSDGTARKIVR